MTWRGHLCVTWRRRAIPLIAAATLAVGAVSLATPPTASAFNPIKPICTVAGFFNGLAQKACSLVSAVGGGGGGGTASTATTRLTLTAVVAWVVGGATYVLHATSHVLDTTTSPQLTSTWFSSTYWRVAGIAAVLTLPFLFAAAVQALVRSDLGLLVRATLGYLPLALLAVGIAAPLTTLLLSASDQLSATVSSAAGRQGAHFLAHSVVLLGAIAATVISPFVVFLVGLLTVAGALILWIELLVREAAVYVIVLMLPLAFAAFVWPARRVWAIRSVELLIALILSKFVIVAVLSLGGAALDQSASHSITGLLAGGVLLGLAGFAPWALLRLIPLAEVASSAASSLSPVPSGPVQRFQQSDARAAQADDWASKARQMRDTAERTGSSTQPASAALSGEEAFPRSSSRVSSPEDSDQPTEPTPASDQAARPQTPIHPSWNGLATSLDLEDASQRDHE